MFFQAQWSRNAGSQVVEGDFFQNGAFQIGQGDVFGIEAEIEIWKCGLEEGFLHNLR